ncbi:Transcription factor GT-2 [Handroanthus impetiginosus]|uniref:Transcription factor GT-2 n=1 Tax=Handroanthus impetiginosus TaxID=429701 RepID=A0A2G9GXC2_9LAMI|nr:Transcription factor GT-2 [Handroanthus impetiginosus]
MESNSMSSGGIYSNVQPGMLGLEMSLHHPVPPQNPPNSHRMRPPPPQSHHPMAAYGHHDGDYHQQPPQTTKPNYPFSAKSKNQSLTLSDDEEPGFAAETSAADDGKRKMSPWQRMKWTDNMVRLLIMVVYYIGDEVSSEGNDSSGKKKGGGVLQKKGKWKSVSQAMMERGFYVSPQQCEDKFNDLNKRYKRVNDILGKGTSCRVVENQSLLDTMDHLSPKTKEEVKKLLNSKHLFFREMCAYHNSCGHGSGGGGGGSGGVQNSPPEAAAQPAQRCLHSSENVSNEGAKLGKGIEDEEDDDENDEDIEDEDDEDEDDDDDDADTDERSTRKKMKRGNLTLPLQSPLMQQLEVEISNVFQDLSKGPKEKRQWMKAKIMRLEEQRVGIQTQVFELEKQRLKWLKFSSKKEREMEREKMANEKTKLENERMVLLVRQKELDLMEFQQRQQQQQYSSNKKSDPSSITG